MSITRRDREFNIDRLRQDLSKASFDWTEIKEDWREIPSIDIDLR